MDPYVSQTNGVEWMLQSTEVEQSVLAQALVEAYFSELYAYILRAAGSHSEALKRAVEATAAAVRERHRISVESSLRAWLFWRAAKQNGRLTGWLSALRRRQEPRRSENNPALEGLDRMESDLLALRYGHGFSSTEIGTVLEAPVQAVEQALGYSRLSAYRALYPETALSEAHLPFLAGLHSQADPGAQAMEHRQGCPHCQAYADRLEELEAALAAAFGKWPAADLQAAYQEVLKKAGLAQREGSRRTLANLKELVLVSALVGGIFLLGSRLDVFTPYDARPTITLTAAPTRTPPTPTLGPLALPGTENVDYFYYTYYPQQEESLEEIAAWSGMSEADILLLNQVRTLASLLPWMPIKLAAFRGSGWFDPPDRAADRIVRVLPLLTEASTPQEVLERMEISSEIWSTYWMDSVYIFRQPPGSILLPPQHSRIQAWAAGSDLVLSIIDNDRFDPNLDRVIQTHGMAFVTTPEGKIEAHDAGGWGWFYYGGRVDGEEFRREMERADLSVGGLRQLDGRSAVGLFAVFDDEFKIRLWVDAETGVSLGMETFVAPDSDQTMIQILTNRIDYNVPILPDLFFPPTTPIRELSSSYLGTPLAQDPQALPVDWQVFDLPAPLEGREPPPQGFDLSQARLTFQKLGEQNEVEIFADQYYLGSLNLLNQMVGTCTRSPDGKRAALQASQYGLFSNPEGLYVVDLETVTLLQILQGAVSSDRLLFSPTGNQLAYTVCVTGCYLYVRDLESGQTNRLGQLRQLTDDAEKNRIIFSPDETSVAALEHSGGPTSRLSVYEVETGELLFRGAYDWELGQVTEPGSPVEDWGEFPPPPPEQGCGW